MAFFFIPDYLTIFAAKSERMELLDGKETARIIKLEIAQQVKARKAEGKKNPTFSSNPCWNGRWIDDLCRKQTEILRRMWL